MSEEDQQGPPQEEVKTEDPQSTINIKVVSSVGEEVFFKIKRSTKLSKLQGAYASKVGKDVGSIRFLYDGERINDDDTPASLDMEDNGTAGAIQFVASLTPPTFADTIDVMVEQVGGVWLRRP
ncbi:ubiquitin-like protein SMT3 [Favolaschia claudopus]|uniref:Ubiquitin-like protein SMT3 n=1 Tax=Favolaschia claudopus TaxID=2862362 RepID=A0AAW0CJR1_9AGAR